MSAYLNHLQSSENLVTTYEATRAGFVALALEKNRRATPYIAEARALQEAANHVAKPIDLLNIHGIEMGLLTAAGLSEKSLAHLTQEDKINAVNGLIENFLDPAGANFVEELVFRFLLTRGDALGGSMRNVGGALAQRKLTRAILSTLTIAGAKYYWQHSKTKKWIAMTSNDTDIELSLRGISWENSLGSRTLIYNQTVSLVKSNVDLCLFNLTPTELAANNFNKANSSETVKYFIALGELTSCIDLSLVVQFIKTTFTIVNFPSSLNLNPRLQQIRRYTCLQQRSLRRSNHLYTNILPHATTSSFFSNFKVLSTRSTKLQYISPLLISRLAC